MSKGTFLKSTNIDFSGDDDEVFLGLRRQKILSTLNIAMLVLAGLAVISLVAEYGFRLSKEVSRWVQWVDVIILPGFVLQGVLRLLYTPDKRDYIKHHWIDLVILGILVLYLVLPVPIAGLLRSINPLLDPESLTLLYLVLTQFFVLLPLIPPVLRYSQKLMAKDVQPSTIIVLSFLFLMFSGTLLLLLPRATSSTPISFVDALFTSTSAVCVTGLTVVDTATYFTPFGQTIIMMLIQVGGLGIMTLTTFFAYVLRSNASLKEYANMQDLLGEDNLGKIRNTVIQIALMTFTIELIGAFFFYLSLPEKLFSPDSDPVFFAAFHSISAFCNAGFALWTNNLMEPELQLNVGVHMTVMMLIVLGGLGFPVLSNIGTVVTSKIRPKPERMQPRLNVHSKLVLVTTLVLIIGGAVGIFFLEKTGEMRNMSFGYQVLTSFVHSISARTAGFNSVNLGNFRIATLFFITMLMWIGASPGSTGGGIKTTTFALSLLNIHAIISGKNRIEVFRKQVATVAVVKAFSTMLLSMFYIATALFLLLLTEPFSLYQLLFEVVSALSTVGLSTGITAQLSTSGKIIIIFTMFVGRVGLLAALIAVTKKRRFGRYQYTEENVLVT